MRCLILAFALLLVAPRYSAFVASAVTTAVTKAGVPFYPPLARAAGVQGVVVAEVTTNGQAFGSIKIISGHPLLSGAVTENLRTWVLVNSPTIHVQRTYRVIRSLRGAKEGHSSQWNCPQTFRSAPHRILCSTKF